MSTDPLKESSVNSSELKKQSGNYNNLKISNKISAKSSILQNFYLLGNITHRKKVYKLNSCGGSTASDETTKQPELTFVENNEKSSCKLSSNQHHLHEEARDSYCYSTTELEKSSANILGNIVRKKCIEPQPQLQLLTIQSLYDNDDDITVHALNLNSSNWAKNNNDLNKRWDQGSFYISPLSVIKHISNGGDSKFFRLKLNLS